MRVLLVIIMTFVLLLAGCAGGETPGGTSEEADPTPVNLGEKLFLKGGKYIYFGSYPQSKVSDRGLKDALMSIAGDTETWTSYDYYIEDDSLRYMVYKDVRHEGEKFRGVYFSEFRPYSTGVISSEENSLQDDNGYKMGKVYWFRYEPIKWKILSSSDGKAFLCAQQIIDAQDFNRSNKETFLCYAKAQGISVEMANASWWWLRSPYEDYNDYTCCVSDDGAVGGYRVTTTYIGVVPAINLDISGK